MPLSYLLLFLFIFSYFSIPASGRKGVLSITGYSNMANLEKTATCNGKTTCYNYQLVIFNFFKKKTG